MRNQGSAFWGQGGIQRWVRRRIKTEEKAKVVASDWGEEFIQFLAALVVLHWMI